MNEGRRIVITMHRPPTDEAEMRAYARTALDRFTVELCGRLAEENLAEALEDLHRLRLVRSYRAFRRAYRCILDAARAQKRLDDAEGR